MDYLLKIRNIISDLEKCGYSEEAQDIKCIRDSASVGSELLMSVTHKLLQMVNQSNEIDNLIGVDVNELKDFCWSIGLMVR